ARVVDYEAEGWLCYMKDLNYDAQGRPLILHAVARGWKPGPEGDPRELRVACWTGSAWEIRTVAPCDNNYDTGSIHVAADGAWPVIAPTDSGPQAYNPGGEMVLWISRDEGGSWEKARTLTAGSEFNHTY